MNRLPTASGRPIKVKTIRVGDHEIRITPTSPRYPAFYLYEVHVDDVLRGWIGFIRRNSFSHHRQRWQAYTWLPQPSHYGSVLRERVNGHAWAEAHVLGETLIEIARNFPAAIEAGKLPTEAETDAILAEADVKNAARKARYASERAHREAEEAAAIEQAARDRSDFEEALRSIRARLSSQLTNFEADVLERLIAVYGVAEVERVDG